MRFNCDLKMPKERKAQFDVLFDLKELSNEADDLIARDIDKLYSLTRLDPWFDAIKDTIIKIKDCDSIADIEYPPHISFYLAEDDKKSKNVDTAISEVQKEHVHGTVQSEVANETIEQQNSKISSSSIASKVKESPSNYKSYVKIATPAAKPSLNANPAASHQILTPQIKKVDSSINVLSNSNYITPDVTKTPILNKTFNKVIHKKLMLDSVSSSSCKISETAGAVCNDSGIKSKAVCKNLIVDKIKVNNNEGLLTKSGSKRKSSGRYSGTKNLMADKLKENNNEGMVTRSGSKRANKQKNTNSGGMLTRSGSKRKSSTSKNKNNKKPKIEACETPSYLTSASNSAQSRHPLVNRNVIKTAVSMASENKSKNSAVIVPTMQKKPVVNSKEEQILKEIQKKDEKANKNIKRVLAERQMRTEQSKKNREEKIAKTLQKRLQLEKEKEERLLKAEMEAKKSQAKSLKESLINAVLKTRTQELIEQHAKANTPGVLTSSKQNETFVLKTPARKISDDCESYELTPLPNSSTYDFSDDEDEKPTGKPIPLWAQGVHVKSALVQQYYNPPDLDKLFGEVIESPNLAEMFGVQKKTYLKRTSSAVWNSPPCVRY